MSKKYVPSFLKDQQSTSNTVAAPNTTQSASFWPGRQGAEGAGRTLSTDNKFAALSDDFPMKKPIINTSLPAQMAPKLVPMTLASATSNGASGAVGASGAKKSFASKFAEHVKNANDPNYKPPPKPVNFSSEDEFPSLGGNKVSPQKEANVVVMPVDSIPKSSSNQSFAEMAKGWAKQKEDDEENVRQKAAAEALLRHKADIMRGIPNINRIRRQYANYDDDEEEEYNPNYDESSLGDDDSYEVSEGNGEPSDEDDENGEEFNGDLGWDGRKRGDLY